MYGLAKDALLGAAAAPYAPDGRDVVVFCFARPEDAQAFAARFGGERLAGNTTGAVLRVPRGR
jgi:hypothetical protein